MDEEHNVLKNCVELAIDRCIEGNVLRDFLKQRREEVVDVIQLNYTFERQLMLEREEGRKEGNVEKLVMQICKKLRKNKSVEEITEDLEEEMSVVEMICRVAEQFSPEYDWHKVKEKVWDQT